MMSKYTLSAVPLEETSFVKSAISKVTAAIVTHQGAYHDDESPNNAMYDTAENKYHQDDYETMANWSYQHYPPVCGGDGCFCPMPSSSSSLLSCPYYSDYYDNHPLIRLVVRWVKIIARSQHGMTVVFGIFPLILGLMIGFYWGRHWEKQQQQKQQQQQQQNIIKPKQEEVRSTVLIAAAFVAQRMKWFIAGWTVLQSVGTFFFSIPATILLQKNDKRKQNIEEVSKIPQIKEKTQDEGDNNNNNNDKRLRYIQDRTKYRQSGVEMNLIPKHMAFIMDGNRRFGRKVYNSVSRGHMEGGYKLRDMVHWCLEECVQEMTVYAFSTENWNRSQNEIDALMSIFCEQCDELRIESKKLQIVVRVLSTETNQIPDHVKEKLKSLEEDTKDCEGSLFLNVCLSYGSRGEIVGACKSLAMDCSEGKIKVDEINEKMVESKLLTRDSPPPDIILRTSGEVRISNFLLWQCAYSEFFFLSKHWPDLQKRDLIEVIRTYAHGRKRRFGA